MTVINNKNISGITSISAQSNSLELFNNAGVSLLDLNTNSVTFPGNISGVGGTLTSNGDIQFDSNNKSIKFVAGNTSISSIECNSNSGPRASIDFLGVPTNQNTDIVFKTSETSSTSAERMRIKRSTGNIGIGTDTPAETLSVAGNVRVENSTDASQYLTIDYQGIDFQNTGAGSSTTSSAHLLDDYEEGTWTPGVEGIVTPGTYTITSAVGTYTKIGNQVTIVGRMDSITETVAGSSSVQITGLPFATANNAVYSIGTIEITNWNIDNATNSLNCFALTNAVKLYIRENRDGLPVANVNLADITSGSSGIRLTMTYLTD